MRQRIVDLNEEYRDLPSIDLGATGGLLFDIGNRRYPPPPIGRCGWTDYVMKWRLDAVRTEAATFNKLQQKQGEKRSQP